MNIFERLFFKAKTGIDVKDLGECEEVVIRYKDVFIGLLIGTDGGEIKSLSWDNQPYNNVAIRDCWVAQPPKIKEEK